MWGVSLAGPVLELPLLLRGAVFLSLFLIGGIFALLGKIELKRAKTTMRSSKPQDSSCLVTSGVYRISRNPMYTGLVFALLGWAAFLCSAWALAGIVLFVLYINRFQIKPEEAFLAGRFGTSFDEYRSCVRRWL